MKSRHLWQKYRYLLILLYWPIYLIWFFTLEKHIVPPSSYFVVYCPLDDLIPFCEYFIIPYVLWYFYIALVTLLLLATDKEDFLRFCGFLFTGMTICLLICTFFPNGQHLRPTEFPRNNLFTQAVRYLYSIDTPTNVLPSMHVLNSIGCHIALMKSKRFHRNIPLQIISWVLLFSITASTMFLKQHSVWDGVAAIILAIPLYVLAYKVNWQKVFHKRHMISVDS